MLQKSLSPPSQPDPSATLTHLLGRWSQGDRQAAEELIPRVYEELRRIAHRLFRRERVDHTLQSTALVHEIYLRMREEGSLQWRDRHHFYRLAACMMRRALIDHSRDRAIQRRGGHLHKVALDGEARRLPRPADWIALDDALSDLARLDPRQAMVVELRFFGGLTVDETAEILTVSPRTAARQWRLAKAYLFRQLDSATRDAFAAPSPGGPGG
ncbi:MAG: sigma-70 family RNA polymerase sigma factor [Acidobacteriota bacterium]